MVASAVGVLVIGASLTLMTNIYKGIAVGKLKTYSLNIASQCMEVMKSSGFYGLQLTPDSCLSDLNNPNLQTLGQCSNNPWPVQSIIAESITFTAYEYVTYAQQDPTTGNIVPESQGYFTGSSQPNIKFIHVMVTYTANNAIKESDLTDFLSNKTVDVSGSTISGTVLLTTGVAPASSTNPTVYVNNQPMTAVNSSGAFTIYNVQPGPCYLSAAALSGNANYFSGSYAANPLTISYTAQTITGITITCVTVNPATITGFLTYSSCGATTKVPASGVLISSNDGLSSIATSTTSASPLNFTITNVNAGSGSGQNVSVNFADPPNNGTAAQVVANVVPGQNTSIGCVQLTAGSLSTGSLTVNVKDSTTLVAISGATVTLINSSNTFTYTFPSTNASGNATEIGITPGSNYSLSVSDAGYMSQNPVLVNVVAGTVNPEQYIQMAPVGSISGNVYDTSNNPIPNILLKVINNYGSGKTVATAYSNASGAYTAQNVPAGNGYVVTSDLSSTSYTWSNPPNGLSPAVTVSKGIPTTGENLTFSLTYQSITGTVSMSGTPVTDGAIIIAFPVIGNPNTNTHTPETFDTAESDHFVQAQTTYVRQKYPSYGSIVTGNGTYSIAVPASGTYNIYAYYSSHTAKPNQAPTYQRYYISVSGVNPGTNQNISGSWTAY
jgi:hypothetical protein